MQVTVTIPDELAAQAERRGISVEEFVQRLVDQAEPNLLGPQQARTSEQIERFLDAMAEDSEKLPLSPTESFSRESFYEDRRTSTK